jgi:K+-sensing histidine kinase KdpD
MFRPVPQWWRKPPALLSYGLAVLSSISAIIIESWLQSGATVSLFLCTIILSAWFGGIGPGLLASAISILSFRYLFLSPIYSFAVDVEHLPRLALFVLVALFVGSLTAAQRSACLRWLDRDVPQLHEVRDSVQLMIKDSNRAADVIQRVRALAKKTDAPKTPLPINEIINEIILLLEHELLSHRSVLRLQLGTELPLALVDRIQIQQVIINLMMNGMEAMSSVADRPRELTIRSQCDESDQVLVAVQDSGVGIEAEHMERLFSAFFTTKPTGMGMGLSICRSIIDAHGGKLFASRNAGAGATFYFMLPAHREHAS